MLTTSPACADVDDDIPGIAITSSPVSGVLTGANFGVDNADVYKIWLNDTQTLRATMPLPTVLSQGASPGLYLYPPSATSRTTALPLCTADSGEYPRSFAYTATSSGYHYLAVLADMPNMGGIGYTIDYSIAPTGYTVTSSAGPHGSISPLGKQSVRYGDTITFTITPDSGYHIAQVLWDGADNGFTEARVRQYTVNDYSDHTLSVTFAPMLATLMPVYRFYNMEQGVHFYTASATEMANVRDTLYRVYRLEGVAYSLNTANPANSTALYRFYNIKKGVHFYTASESERNDVIARLSSTYRLEGMAYKVCATPVAGATPVYRFYNIKKGVHFYTASESERNTVATTLASTYRFEGAAYYLAP